MRTAARNPTVLIKAVECVNWTEATKEALRWLIDDAGCPHDSSVTARAAEVSSFVSSSKDIAQSVIQKLKFLAERGVACDTGAALQAAAGHLDVLKYLVAERGISVGPLTCAYAAKYMQVDNLKWLHARGVKWDEKTAWSSLGTALRNASRGRSRTAARATRQRACKRHAPSTTRSGVGSSLGTSG